MKPASGGVYPARKRVTLVGIGGVAVSRDAGVQLRTMALGSCVAIVACDTRIRAMGMVHAALPKSSPSIQGRPAGYFVDTGLTELVAQMRRAGSSMRTAHVHFKLVGGASTMHSLEGFNIGKRNILAARKALWKAGFVAIAEDVGGRHSRTVGLEPGELSLAISCPDVGTWTL